MHIKAHTSGATMILMSFSADCSQSGCYEKNIPSHGISPGSKMSLRANRTLQGIHHACLRMELAPGF
jgi:hypothetical protein